MERLVEGKGDVGIVMETKHLWSVIDRQTTNVFHVHLRVRVRERERERDLSLLLHIHIYPLECNISVPPLHKSYYLGKVLYYLLSQH